MYIIVVEVEMMEKDTDLRIFFQGPSLAEDKS